MFRRPTTPWTAGTKVAVISHPSNTPLTIINRANVSFDCGRTLSQLRSLLQLYRSRIDFRGIKAVLLALGLGERQLPKVPVVIAHL